METKIIERIQKLLALQKDAEAQGSLEEAANAASKAQTLLLKHNLDLAKVNGHSKVDVILTEISCKGTGWNKRQGKWMQGLYKSICDHNFCALVLSSGWDKEEVRLNVMGEPHNLEVVEYMGYTLSQILLRMEKKAWVSYKGLDKKGTFRRGYLLGATLAINQKLEDMRSVALKESDQVAALVLVQSKKVEDFKNNKYQDLKKSRKGGTNSTAVGQGYADGKKVAINKGVGQGKERAQIDG